MVSKYLHHDLHKHNHGDNDTAVITHGPMVKQPIFCPSPWALLPSKNPPETGVGSLGLRWLRRGGPGGAGAGTRGFQGTPAGRPWGVAG